jgi:hypothetical protein
MWLVANGSFPVSQAELEAQLDVTHAELAAARGAAAASESQAGSLAAALAEAQEAQVVGLVAPEQ